MMMLRKSITKRLGAGALQIALGAALLPTVLHAESLYPGQGYRALGADHKATRIGDVLTIQILESSSATSSADTSTGRNATNNVNFNLSRVPTATLNTGVKSDFDGGGTTERSGRLLAQMTATITGYTSNGDLLIGGEQLLTVNDEKQKIFVKGRVRPEDISSSNTVLSTRIADAQIIYLGDGTVAGRQKPAWWTRFLNWLGF